MPRFYNNFTNAFINAGKFAVLDSLQTLSSTAIAYTAWSGYASFFSKPNEQELGKTELSTPSKPSLPPAKSP
jgi:hypothetical protein